MSNPGMSRYSPRNSMPVTDAINQLMRNAFTAPLAFAAATPLIADMNLHETNDSYILQVPLSRMKPDQLQITARENVATIQGATDFLVPDTAHPISMGTRQEEIREQVQLPGDVNADRASASYENGILTLRLPKSASSHERAIGVALGQGQSQSQSQTQKSQAQNQQTPRERATTGQG